MDFGAMIGNSIEYAKDSVWGKWVKWVLLAISYIIFPLIMGYIVRIYRGVKPAPELENWGSMFIDGVKLFVIGLIYAIPVMLVFFIFGGAGIFGLMSAGNAPNDALIAAALGSLFLGIILAIIVGIIISLIAMIGTIRFARKDSMGEAFNISAILAHIGKIGWGSYIIALIVLWLVSFVFAFVIGLLSAIPVIGWIIALFLYPVFAIFTARYMTLIYESAPAPA